MPLPSPTQQLDRGDEDRLSFLEAIQVTLDTDSSVLGLVDTGHRPDPDFTPEAFESELLSPDVQKRLERLSIDPEFLGRAESRDHFYGLLDRAEQEMDNEAKLVNNFGARFVGNMLDPLDWTVSLGTGGSAAFFLKGKRMHRLLKTGLVAAGTNAAIESSVASQSAFRDMDDIMAAALFGFAIGAPLGSLGRDVDNQISKAANDANRAFRRNEMHLPGGQAMDHSNSGRVIRRSAEGEELRPEIVEQILNDPEPGELFFQALQKFQFNYASTFYNSSNPLARRLGARLIEVGVPLKGHKTKRHTAEGRKYMVQRTMDTIMMRVFDHHFRDWMLNVKGKGKVRAMFSLRDAHEFSEEVSRAIRGDYVSISPQAKAIAGEHGRIMEAWLRAAQEAGVRGFDNIEPNPKYLPRLWHPEKLTRLRQNHGAHALESYLQVAIRVNGKSINDLEVRPLIQRMARGMAQTLNDKSVGVSTDLAHAINLDDLEALRVAFGTEADEIITMIEKAKASKQTKAGKPTRAKQRVELDERASWNGITIGDLVENDYRQVMLRYSSTMAGHIGLAKEAGIHGRTEANNIIADLRRAGSVKEANALEELYRLLTGAPFEENPRSNFSTFSRLMSKYNFIRVGGGFGIPQIPELANPIAFIGLKNMISYMPEFRKFLRLAQDGQLDSKLARELDSLLGAGTDFLRNPAIAGFSDDLGIEFGAENLLHKVAQKLDPTLAAGGRLTSALSGMAPLLVGFQRFAGMGYAVRFSEFARGKLKGRKLANWKKRMYDAGLTDEQMEGVARNIREHAEFKKGKLVALNPQRWTDAEGHLDTQILDAYRMSGVRLIRRSIQENDLGNVGSHIQGPLGRMLFQFMTFTFNSINKQLLHGLAMNDVLAYTQFTTAIFFAGTAYIAQNSLNYANDPETRKERLAPEEIAKAAFAKAGFLAIMPPIADNARLIAGFDPMFGNVRSSGLGTTVIDANPTVTALRDLAHLTRIPGSMFHPDFEITQEHTRRMWNVLPFHNLLGARNALAIVNEGRSKTLTRDED